jgi:hypothetical protein
VVLGAGVDCGRLGLDEAFDGRPGPLEGADLGRGGAGVAGLDRRVGPIEVTDQGDEAGLAVGAGELLSGWLRSSALNSRPRRSSSASAALTLARSTGSVRRAILTSPMASSIER